MALPSYAGPGEIAWYYGYRIICALIFLFLIVPILVIIPLSFNTVPFFTFTKEMLTLDPEGFSLRWYKDFVNRLRPSAARVPSTVEKIVEAMAMMKLFCSE